MSDVLNSSDQIWINYFAVNVHEESFYLRAMIAAALQVYYGTIDWTESAEEGRVQIMRNGLRHI